MSNTAISRDIALRIALAARELPDTDVARLLRVLSDAVGLPPSGNSLGSLTVKLLKHAADGEFADIDNDYLKQAIAILKGESNIAAEAEQIPPVEEYTEGDMPGSVRVACASNGTEELDGHFGSCRRFMIYQVDANNMRLIDIRNTADASTDGDKNVIRAALINDCNVLFVASIGGPAAAKVVKAGIHPMKYPAGGNIRDLISRLQEVLAASPPPWLAKAMGLTEEDRVRFELTTGET